MSRSRLAVLWTGYLMVGILLLEVIPAPVYPVVVAVFGLGLAAFSVRLSSGLTWMCWNPRWLDIVGLVALYVAIVALFRLAFGVFTTSNTAGLFLAFAGGLALGVVAPLVHVVGVRREGLDRLGLSARHLPETIALAIGLAGLQAAIVLPKVSFGAPESWLPLLMMALTVGFFEAVFFRGYVIAVFEPAFGLVPAVAASAGLYALYHVGYGMSGDGMLFLAGLGIVYAVAFAVARSILVLWPLLTPLGGFVATVQSGDISLPLESILGFGWLLVGMGAAVFAASRWHRAHPHRSVPRRPIAPPAAASGHRVS